MFKNRIARHFWRTNKVAMKFWKSGSINLAYAAIKLAKVWDIGFIENDPK